MYLEFIIELAVGLFKNGGACNPYSSSSTLTKARYSLGYYVILTTCKTVANLRILGGYE
jgi:hypothetical protein